MYFVNSRTKNIFFPIAILAIFVVSAAFGALVSSAESNHIRPKQANKTTAQRRQSRKLERFAFPPHNSASIFSGSNQPLLKVLVAGQLDTTFGVNGKVTTQIGSSSRSEALAIALQPDGKFVSAGYSANSANSSDFALARYNSDGSLDATFGTGGKVTTDIGNDDNASFALAIQTDGKFVAAGSRFNGADDDFALIRYNSDGTLDNTFGAGGIVTTNFGGSSEIIDAITIQPDGKIVAAGYRVSGSFFDFALARYNSNGSLDDTFGSGGRITTSITDFDDLARAIALQADGKIVVVGEANADFAAARYNANGSLDTTFDGDGTVVTSINLFDSAYDVAIQGDGKIVAAGEAGNGSNSDFALVRYESNGSLDATFDGDGKVTTTIGESDEFASSVAIQASGNIIAGGFSYNGANDDFALVRYNSNGSLDLTFGAGGRTTTDFGNSSFDYISAIAVQSTNRLIAVGSANSSFAAAAYSIETAGCSYSLSPSSADFPASGGAGSFNVNTQSGCAYTAVSNAQWITLSNGINGNGSGTVSFLVASNSSAARTGTITVAGQTFTVNQALGVKSRKRVRFF